MKEKIAFLLCVLLSVGCSTYISYDYGECKDFHSGTTAFPTFSCSGNAVYTTQINFKGTFKNQPQIILHVYYYDVKKGYLLSIGPVDLTYFNVTLLCPASVTGLNFYWTAIDDRRINVFNNFNIDGGATGLTTKNYTFTHSNKYATKGYAGMISFQQNGVFDYSLEVTSVTASEVIVKFTTTSSNLVNFGFFVVIGTEDAFTLQLPITLNSVTQGTIYSSLGLPISQTNGKFIFVPIIGLDWSVNSQNIRIGTSYTIDDTSYQYNLTLWASSKYAKFVFENIYYYFQNIKVLDPFLCTKMKISKKYVNDTDSNNLKLYWKEQNQFYYAGDTLSILLDPQTLALSFSAFLSCRQSTKKYSVTVLRCFTSCSQQFQNIQYNCYGGINLIQHDFFYNQNDVVYQKLQLSLNSTSILLTQTTFTTDVVLLQIQMT